MKVKFASHVSKNRRGHHGTSVQVAFDQTEGGWHHSYHFDTYGMTPEEIAARVEKIRTHHLKKCARLDGFASIQGSQITVAGAHYRLTDCNVWERGEDVELYLDVREPGAEQSPHGFPMRRVFATIDDVPDNGAILAIVRDELKAGGDMRKAHDETLTRSKALIERLG